MFPKRPRSHIVGEEAVRMFCNCLPHEWIIQELSPDYGLDLYVQIVDGDLVTGEEFFVQVKGTDQLTGRQDNETRYLSIPQRTVNFWLSKLPPTFIAKVEVKRRTLWFNWLEYAYSDYPTRKDTEGEIGLLLRRADNMAVGGEFLRDYVQQYYKRVRDEGDVLFKNNFLLRFLYVAVQLERGCMDAHFYLLNGSLAPEVRGDGVWQSMIYMGLMDEIIEGFWKQFNVQRPEASQLSSALTDLYDDYCRWSAPLTHRVARHSDEAQKAKDEGFDGFIVRIRHDEIEGAVLPTLGALGNLIEFVADHLVLHQAVMSDINIGLARLMRNRLREGAAAHHEGKNF